MAQNLSWQISEDEVTLKWGSGREQKSSKKVEAESFSSKMF